MLSRDADDDSESDSRREGGKRTKKPGRIGNSGDGEE
jgi:hypothetical protein